MISLPMEKVEKCRSLSRTYLNAEKITLKSLIGTLNFAYKAVRPGRAFLRRLIDLTHSLLRPFHHVRFTKGAKLDMNVWLSFLEDYNGTSLMLYENWLSSNKINLFSDASGKQGFAAIYGTQWLVGTWSTKDNRFHIAWKELVPITLAFEL